MKKSSLLLFSSFLVSISMAARVAGPLDAPFIPADPTLSTDQKLGTGFLFSAIEKVKGASKGSLLCSIESYLNTLGIDAYQSTYHMGKTTAGVGAYFEGQLAENPCLAEVAAKFAMHIEAKQTALSDGPGGVVSLQEKLGAGRFKPFPPGWAWQEALSFTNGDKNAALFLLGMCAYEEEPTYNFRLSGKQKVALARIDLQKLQKELKEEKASLASLEEIKTARSTSVIESQKNTIRIIQEQIQKKTLSIDNPNQPEDRYIRCPDNMSAFTAPQSLGGKIDIPDELKSKVTSLQRPQGRNLDSLKAKYYHVIGSAFMGCQLKKCGLPKVAIKAWEREAGGMYRAIRLCSAVKTNLKTAQELGKKIGRDIFDPNFRESVKSYLEEIAQKLIVEGREYKKARTALFSQGFRGEDLKKRLPRERCLEDVYLNEKDPLLSYLCNATYKLREGEEDAGRKEQALDKLLQEYDASLMFQKWYLGGEKILGYDLPCTGIKIKGPTQLDGKNTDCKMKGWSAERCSTALAKLGTWDVDFEWTRAQHEVGAAFGAEQCEEQEADEKPDKRFCKIADENNKKELYDKPKIPALNTNPKSAQ